MQITACSFPCVRTCRYHTVDPWHIDPFLNQEMTVAKLVSRTGLMLSDVRRTVRVSLDEIVDQDDLYGKAGSTDTKNGNV